MTPVTEPSAADWGYVQERLVWTNKLKRAAALELGYEAGDFFTMALDRLRTRVQEDQSLARRPSDAQLDELLAAVLPAVRREYVRRAVAADLEPGPRDADSGRPRPLIGTGAATGHHGELLQGTFDLGPRSLVRALVTLPYYNFRSEAEFILAARFRGVRVRVTPGFATKAARAAELTLDALDLRTGGGRLRVRSIGTRPPEGAGGGSSTIDVVAAIRAVAGAAGHVLRPEDVAPLAVMAEAASDSIMFTRVVLFAHREGIVVEDFGSLLPTVLVCGFNSDPHHPVATTALPRARFSTEELGAFEVLRGGMRGAIDRSDSSLLGRIARASAALNQANLPNVAYHILAELTDASDSCVGFQVAHSGTLAALLFDPMHPNCDHELSEARFRLQTLGFESYCWRTDRPNEEL